MVSLNNRIYFRDHPFRGVNTDSRCHVDTGRTARTNVTSVAFVRNELSTTSTGDGIKFDTSADSGTASVDVEKGAVIGDDKL